METISRTSCERVLRTSCDRNSFERIHFDRACSRRRRPSFSESEDIRMRRSNSFSDGEERLSGSFCDGAPGLYEWSYPSICKRHRLTNNSDWTNIYRWRSAQKRMMQALTPLPVASISSSPSVSQLQFSPSFPPSPSRRLVARRDLELDCLNESEAAQTAPLQPFPPTALFDHMATSAPLPRARDFSEQVQQADRIKSTPDRSARYGDVGLLVGLCSPPPPLSSAVGASDDDEDLLPLLLKYTHVVGAN